MEKEKKDDKLTKLLSEIKHVERKLDLLNSNVQTQEERIKDIEDQRLKVKKCVKKM